jgi:hypothetical protein
LRRKELEDWRGLSNSSKRAWVVKQVREHSWGDGLCKGIAPFTCNPSAKIYRTAYKIKTLLQVVISLCLPATSFLDLASLKPHHRTAQILSRTEWGEGDPEDPPSFGWKI